MLCIVYLMSVVEPQLEIVIQPKQHGQRFRYKCESKSAGSLLGEGSTNEQKVYPTVEVDFHFLCWISVSDFHLTHISPLRCMLTDSCNHFPN